MLSSLVNDPAQEVNNPTNVSNSHYDNDEQGLVVIVTRASISLIKETKDRNGILGIQTSVLFICTVRSISEIMCFWYSVICSWHAKLSLIATSTITK